MRVFAGQYDGSVTTQSAALVTNLLKYPEISKTLLFQYKQYTFTYLSEWLGRINGEETDDKKLIGANKIEWHLVGRLNQPSTIVGFVGAGRGAGHTVFTLTVEENFLNKYDRVRFRSGNTALIIAEPTPNGSNWDYQMKLETNDTTLALPNSDGAAGISLGSAGSGFPEGSRRGYQNKKYPDKYVNWLTIMRKECSFTGSAFTDVTWIENNGHRLWYFTEQELTTKEFLYQLELARWYGNTTVDAADDVKVTDDEGNEIITGDGILAQIDPGNTDTYTVLTRKLLVSFMVYLATRSNFAEGNAWVVFTGMAGLQAFYEVMNDYIHTGGNFMYDMKEGQEVEVGLNVFTFHAVNQKITLCHNPIFDDPHLHTLIDPTTNLPFESSRLVFLNFAVEQGVSNIEIFNKGAEGFNRSFIMKYIPGMMDPFNPQSMVASNSNDGFTFEILTESGVVIRDPLCCGMLEKVGY